MGLSSSHLRTNATKQRNGLSITVMRCVLRLGKGTECRYIPKDTRRVDCASQVDSHRGTDVIIDT